MEHWKDPDDRLWALREAAKPGGFMPNARGTVTFLSVLEAEGLLRGSDTAPVWSITDLGRAELAKLAQ